MTENKEQNKSKDWRFAPQPVRLYRSKYAARCVFAISRRLARAKTDLLPVMNGLERDARRSRTAGSVGGYLAAMDGLVSEQLGLAHKLGIEPDTEDLSRTAELAELAEKMSREAA